MLDSDEDEGDGGQVEFKVNQDYAKKYDDWRAKEEMQKRKSIVLTECIVGGNS